MPPAAVGSAAGFNLSVTLAPAVASITIHTTQNVSIDYELAGAGTRLGAFCLDLAILVIGYLALAFAIFQLELGPTIGETTIFVFGPLFTLLGYFFFVEMLNRGQSLGKRLVGLRVVRTDGRDPTPADFLARAVFLLPDVVFSSGSVALLLISTGGQKQRLGDIVAGTAVILTHGRRGVSLTEVLNIRNRADHEPEFTGVTRFTDEDMMLVKEALLRLRRYDNAAHRGAVRELAVRLAELLELDPAAVPYRGPEFLERLLVDYIVLTR